MQKTLFENCLAVNFQQLMNFKDYHPSEGANRDIFGGAAIQVLNFDTEMNTYIQTSFNDSRKFIRMGFLCFLCYFFCCFTVWCGVVPLLSNAFGGGSIKSTASFNSTGSAVKVYNSTLDSNSSSEAALNSTDIKNILVTSS